MKKIKLGVFLPKSLVENFRNLIMQKYNRYEKGLLSYEVEMALRSWLALHTKAQKTLEVKKPNPTPKVYMYFAEVKDYLLRKYYTELWSGQQIPYKHLEEAIINTRGADKRTVQKWLRIFHTSGLVKPVTSASWEIM